MKGPDDMPAPARDGHQHTCGDWCFCFISRAVDCEKCRRKKANARMRAEYDRSRSVAQ